MKEKTATSGVRYKINDLEFIKKKERLNTLQEVVYFLMSEYLKLYKVEKVSIFSAPKDVYDGPRLPNNFTHDEPPMFPLPKPESMFSAPVDKFKEHKNNITYSDSKKELVANVTAMKKDMFLNNKQKMELEAYAKQVMEEKGFIYND